MFPRREVTPSHDRLAEAQGDDHLLDLYDSDDYLVEAVTSFAAPALRAGEVAVLIATAEHLRGCVQALRDMGFDVDALRADDRLVTVDTAEVLPKIMADGSLVPARARALGEGLLVRARGRGVRVYGETVALLWDAGHVTAALALEDIWNDLSARHACPVFCTYPTGAFDREASTEGFRTLCEQHSAVLPGERYAAIGDPDEWHRVVAGLHHEAVVGVNERVALRARVHELEIELRRLRALDRLREALVATMVASDPPAHAAARRRSVDALRKTAERQVRRALPAAVCAFQPTGTVHAPAAGGVAVPVVSSAGRHGTLRVAPAPGQPFDERGLRFLHAVAEVLGAGFAHAAPGRAGTPESPVAPFP
jgi:hypothetical protein